MLIKLIKSEIKKIFKIKMNIILFLIAILGTSVFVGLKYFEYRHFNLVENQQGEMISEVSLLRYMDETRHQYAGAWSLDKAKQYQQDFQGLIQKYRDSAKIDNDVMELKYGKNYQELVDKYSEKRLTTQSYFDYMKDNGLEGYIIDSDGENDKDLWNLHIYYENDPILEGLQSAYIDGGTPEAAGGVISEISTLLLDKKNELNEEELKWEVENNIVSNKSVEQMKLYLSKQAQSLPNTFDSTIPNMMIVNAMDNCLWIPIICIIIMLANIFGIEKQYNVEQLIYPTKASVFKITIAKIIAGTLIAFGTMLMTILSCLIVGYMILPVHTWNVAAWLFEGSNPFISAFTYQDILTYIIGLGLMSSLATACIALVLSYITKNRFVVIVIMFLYFGFIIFFNIPGYFRMLHPYVMTHINEYFYNIHAYSFINNQVIPFRISVLLIWSVIIILVFGGMILRSKMKSARIV